MFEQYNTKYMMAMSKHFSDTAFKAHQLAINAFEKAVDLQLKTVENRMTASVDFMNQAIDAKDMNGMRDLFPRSVSLMKDSAEKMYNTSQEMMGLTMKTSEAIGELLKDSMEAANETIKPGMAKKAASR